MTATAIAPPAGGAATDQIAAAGVIAGAAALDDMPADRWYAVPAADQPARYLRRDRRDVQYEIAPAEKIYGEWQLTFGTPPGWPENQLYRSYHDTAAEAAEIAELVIATWWRD